MEALLPILMQLIGGTAGGGIAGKLLGGNMNSMMTMITGAVGGIGGSAIAGMIPGLDGLLGKATEMASSASDAAGATAASGFDFGALAGQGVTGLAGGGILTGVVGLITNAMKK